MAQMIAYRGKGNVYLNVTNRCSCACTFCLREFTTEVYGYDLRLEHEPDLTELTRAVELELVNGPAGEVVFCGLGEPTLRLDLLLAMTEWLRLRRLPSRLDTNGLGSLANPGIDVAGELAAAGLDSVSISLNAADPRSYADLCRPIYSKAYRAVLGFARDCVAAGLATTLTALDGTGADIEACAVLARTVGAGFRVRALTPPPAYIPLLQEEVR